MREDPPLPKDPDEPNRPLPPAPTPDATECVVTSPAAQAAQQWLDAQPDEHEHEHEFDPNRRRWGLAVVVVAALTLALYLLDPFPRGVPSTGGNAPAAAFLGGLACLGAAIGLTVALARSTRRRQAAQGLQRQQDEPPLTDHQHRRASRQIAGRAPIAAAERPYVALTAQRNRAPSRQSALSALIGVSGAAGFALMAGAVWPAGLVLALVVASTIRDRRRHHDADRYLRNASDESDGQDV